MHFKSPINSSVKPAKRKLINPKHEKDLKRRRMDDVVGRDEMVGEWAEQRIDYFIKGAEIGFVG